MGLFPSVTGLQPAVGVGILQFVAILMGFATARPRRADLRQVHVLHRAGGDLAQQIGVRLTLTGMVLAGLTGMADFLGFGSHARTATTDMFFGQLQAIGLLGSLLLSAIGVIIYTLSGSPRTKIPERLFRRYQSMLQ